MPREPQTEQARDEITDCLRDWEVSASARVVVGSRRVRDSDGAAALVPRADEAGRRSGRFYPHSSLFSRFSTAWLVSSTPPPSQSGNTTAAPARPSLSPSRLFLAIHLLARSR